MNKKLYPILLTALMALQCTVSARYTYSLSPRAWVSNVRNYRRGYGSPYTFDQLDPVDRLEYLDKATRARDINTLRALHQRNPDYINELPHNYANTPLGKALARRDIGAMKTLVEAGATVDKRGPLSTPAIMQWEVLDPYTSGPLKEQPHVGGVEYLISRGADVEGTDMDGKTAMDRALRHLYSESSALHQPHTATLKKLVEVLKQAEAQKHQRPALHLAAKYHDVSKIKDLLAAGADVQERDIYGRTPRYYAMVHNPRDYAVSPGAVTQLLGADDPTELPFDSSRPIVVEPRYYSELEKKLARRRHSQFVGSKGLFEAFDPTY